MIPAVGTPQAEAVSALSSFDGLARGDAAPAWIRDGVVGAWGLDPGAEVALVVLSENVTFAVRIGGSARMIVRLGRPGYAATTDHIRSELVWVDALRRDIGAPTPAPIRGADGDLVQLLGDPDGRDWTAVAFDFVAGSALEDRPDVAAHFREIGALTARLHEHARAWRPPAGFTRFAWATSDMVGPSARWGDWSRAPLAGPDAALLGRAQLRALEALDAAGISARDARHWGLIHADLRPSNVMSDGSRMSIIDFDDCGYGFYLYDFAAALTFYEHRPEAAGMAADWLGGYREVRALGADEIARAAALSMLRRLTMLGWQTTHRSDALPPDLWDENQPGTVEVAARYLEDPLWLVRG
ncbi:phosphotransferase enzyme family protein [Microbacterium indicum]|uniref:phosphotransferase enzyme family protein n=1 Tax=Microbacterium indicum TaxID=358100 RepID=UPI00040A3D08|nr:phosphotransferase [Microbacterium indicum]